MLYYLIPILIALLLSIFELTGINKNGKFFIHFFLFITAFILCSGYMTGSDWRNYELLFESASFKNLHLYAHETGFYIYMCFLKSLGFTFFPFLIFSKVLVFYGIFNFLKQYSVNTYMSFFIFLSMVGTGALFLFVDNPFRFMLSFGIVTLSYKYLINRSPIRYFLLIFLAASFHISSLLMIIVYFVSKKVPFSKLLALLFLIGYFVITPKFLLFIVDGYFPIIYEYIGAYIEKMKQIDHSYFSIGKFFFFILFYIVLLYRKLIEEYSNGKLFFALSMCFFGLFLLSNVIPTFHRLMIFVLPFLIFSLVLILEYSYNRIVFNVFLYSYLLLSMVKGVYSTWTYIPYTNYFVYLFKEDLSYTERYNYNANAYFLRTGKYPENFKIK